MSTTPARQPQGQPTGGQFAAKSNPESEVDLAEYDPTSIAPRRTSPLPVGVTEVTLPDGRREWWKDGEEVPPPVGTPISTAEARALPSYTEVMATFDVTDDRMFRLMARDIPRFTGPPPGSDYRPDRRPRDDSHLSRRFTNLDTGSEVFLGGDDGMNSPSSTVHFTSVRVSAHG